jgi:hypothetical protein
MAIPKQLSALLPLQSFFFTLFDLKLGSEIITWFAILNKVAGFYGLLAIFYSVASIFLFSWGAKQVGEVGRFLVGCNGLHADKNTLHAQENPSKVLTYAHFYLIDHLISTLYIAFFGVTWYSYTPHDGRRVANSAAQKEILEAGLASGNGQLDDAERARMALQVWNDEKGFSTTVLILGWVIKVCHLLLVCMHSDR